MLIAFFASLDSKWWICVFCCVRIFFIFLLRCSFWLLTCINIPDVFISEFPAEINFPSFVARLRLHELSAGRMWMRGRGHVVTHVSAFWWRHLNASFPFSDIPECLWVISTKLCCRMTYTSSQTFGHIIYSVFTCYSNSKACKLWNHTNVSPNSFKVSVQFKLQSSLLPCCDRFEITPRPCWLLHF